MKTLLHTIRRWRLPLVCFLWLVAILGLFPERRYGAFLSSSFVPVLIVAAAVLFFLMCLSLVRENVPRLGLRELLATAVILLPLVHLHAASGVSLGSSALANRYVGAGVGGMLTPGPAAGTTGENVVSLLTLFTETERFDGQAVTVVGRLAVDNPEVAALYGEPMPLLFRFVITCCAADAIPLAVVLEDGNAARSVQADAWLEASGRFRMKTVAGHDLLVMEDVTARPVPAPAQPYLYMQWGYF